MFNKLRQLQKLKSSMSKEEVTGTAAEENIKLHMNGTMDITGIEISESFLQPANKSKIETGLVAAYKDARDAINKTMMDKMKSGDIDMDNLA
ncbi:MAG: YbaB/EbfC family nucleoid-associated protein [bacterium]